MSKCFPNLNHFLYGRDLAARSSKLLEVEEYVRRFVYTRAFAPKRLEKFDFVVGFFIARSSGYFHRASETLGPYRFLNNSIDVCRNRFQASKILGFANLYQFLFCRVSFR